MVAREGSKENGEEGCKVGDGVWGSIKSVGRGRWPLVTHLRCTYERILPDITRVNRLSSWILELLASRYRQHTYK